MSEANKIAHLGFIQSVIARMASNSFAIKSWSISITAAMIAAGIALKSPAVVLTTLVPILTFIFLDSYFFLQEKNYRNLYNKTRKEEFDNENPFNLTPPKDIYKLTVLDRIKELKERSVLPVYLTQGLLVISTLLIMA